MRSKMLLFLGMLITSSCSHPYNLDNTGEDQFDVCASACFISTSIRDDKRTKTAFIKANEAINNVFRSKDYTKTRLITELNKSLVCYPAPVKDKVIAEILKVYDLFSSKDEIWGLQMTQEAILLNFQSQFFHKFL